MHRLIGATDAVPRKGCFIIFGMLKYICNVGIKYLLFTIEINVMVCISGQVEWARN